VHPNRAAFHEPLLEFPRSPPDALCSGRAAQAAKPRQAEHQRKPLSAVAACRCCDCRRNGEWRRVAASLPGPGAERLKAAVAARYDEFGISPQQVFVGNGSDEVLAHVFMALLKHELPIFFPDITYSFYPVYCGLYESLHVAVPLDENFEIRSEDYAAANGGIIFPNPNAPTGCLLPLPAIERLLLAHHRSVVVVDEAYIDFGGESALALVNHHPNLLVVHTLSKSRSLAGLRVGYAVGHHELIEALERVKNSFNSYPLDRLAIAGAVAAIGDQEHFETTRQAVITVARSCAAHCWAGFRSPAFGGQFHLRPSPAA
jgi:histidinol-phosphate aminotransferase